MPIALIVDDNMESRYFLEVLLKGHGFGVRSAENGSEALKTALADPPDLIVSDILMPVMDGFALCREWKSRDALKRIPFIFYTATYTEREDEEFALSLGADRFVTKPQDPGVLVGIIRDTLSASRPRDESGNAEEPSLEGDHFPEQHSKILFRKLEKKMADLEEANRELLRTIAELEKTEKALKESETKYRNIFENAVMGIFQTTPEGRYVSANKALSRTFGFDSPEEMMNAVTDMGSEQYVNPADRERLKEFYRRDGFVEAFEAELYRKDGSRIWISMNGRAVADEKGNVLYYEGTTEDISARKQAEEEKSYLESQLLQAQKMEAIGTLAGGVAHDFNNILTAIIGFGSLLQMDMDEGGPTKAYVDQILSASHKAANLTQGLLAFSRKQRMELKPNRLSQLIGSIEKLLRRLLTEDIDLVVRLGEGNEAVIMSDAGQIDQVLINLVTNARDAMPKGGKLTIEAGTVDVERQVYTAHGFVAPGRYVVISVTDTGTGMDEQTKEKIFEPFFTTKEAGKGTGLGLSIAYGIVKQHEGFVQVVSEPGQGTSFHLYFPIAARMAEDSAPAREDMRGGTETILVAEDNSQLRTLIKEVLERKGYRVIEAADGADAVQKFKERKDDIDLLVLDVVMPRKNGKEAYEEIAKLRPDARVCFTSGYTGDVVLGKGIRDESVDYISKPLSPNDLLLKVRQVLDR